MTTEYAGILHSSPHSATLAAVDAFMTAHGTESVVDSIHALVTDREFIIDQLYAIIHTEGWALPNVADPNRERVAELLDEWKETEVQKLNDNIERPDESDPHQYYPQYDDNTCHENKWILQRDLRFRSKVFHWPNGDVARWSSQEEAARFSRHIGF